MARDFVTGQFQYDGNFDRLCRCGHALGVHVDGGWDCLNGEVAAGGDGTQCACSKFTPDKEKGAGQ